MSSSQPLQGRVVPGVVAGHPMAEMRTRIAEEIHLFPSRATPVSFTSSPQEVEKAWAIEVTRRFHGIRGEFVAKVREFEGSA